MSDYLVRRIEATPNITVRLRSEVVDGKGATAVQLVHEYLTEEAGP